MELVSVAYPHRAEYERKVAHLKAALRQRQAACLAAGPNDLQPLLALPELRKDAAREAKNLELINRPDPDASTQEVRQALAGLTPSMPPAYAPPSRDPPGYAIPLDLAPQESYWGWIRDAVIRPPGYEAEALARARDRSYGTTGWARMTARKSRLYQL